MKQINHQESMEYALGILKRFDRLCQDNGLRYSVAYGTMIGCIRHKGFIPWDDDIDVMMPRADYEKLLQLQFHEGPYELRHYRYTDGYYYPFAKMIDNRTLLKEVNRCEQSMGIFIDVFPFDFLPDGYVYTDNSLKTMKKHWDDMLKIGMSLKNPNAQTKIHRRIGRCFYYCMVHPFRKQLLALKEGKYLKAQKTDSDLTFCQFSSFKKGSFITENEWKNIIRMPFEDTEVCVLAAYDRILKGVYGDYMQLPPEEKRVCPHQIQIWLKDKNEGNL